MKVCHDDEADSGDDETPELSFLVRGHAFEHVVGDFLIEKDDCATSGEDTEA